MARATANPDPVEAAVVVDWEVKERLDPLLAAALLETADGQKLPADRPDKLELRQPHVLEEALLPTWSAAGSHCQPGQTTHGALKTLACVFGHASGLSFQVRLVSFINPPFIHED